MKWIKVGVILFFIYSLAFNISYAKETEVALLIANSEEQLEEAKGLIEDKLIRHQFRNIFLGFTFESSISTIQQLKETGYIVERLHAIQTTSLDNNLSIIGVEETHRKQDSSNNYLTGQGIRVGIIDTGIDYGHRDLEDSYGGGHDLVDNDSDPMESIKNKKKITSHGTHVAGIIAANGKMVGVAPNAIIISYRALGPKGNGTTEQVIASIEKAIEDKVDILNLSLGSSVNGPDLPITIALNKAVESGIVAVVAAGNSGPENWTVGSPGTASKAITVGASTPELKNVYLKVNGEFVSLIPMANSILWNIPFSKQLAHKQIVANTSEEDLSNKIVLVERGEISFYEKSLYAYKNGAVAVLIYNNEDGMLEGGLQQSVPIPVYSLSKRDGKWLKELLQKDKTLMVTAVEKKEKDRLASFSSKGPVTHTFEIKPDVVAPGVAIESTVPEGYAPMQGTSMAAPHVAGACAILKQAHPDWEPYKMKSALVNTAKILKDTHGENYKVFEQGGGRIQIVEALQTQSIIEPSSLNYGRIANKRENLLTVTIENISKEEQKYSFEIPKKLKGVSWYLPKAFYLKPNEKKEIVIGIEVKEKWIQDQLIEGYITLHSSKQKLTIPYLLAVHEPDYPRVYGVNWDYSMEKREGVFEAYFPEDVEELFVTLYRLDTLKQESFLIYDTNINRGQYEKKWTGILTNFKGMYELKVMVKSKGREWIESIQFQF